MEEKETGLTLADLGHLLREERIRRGLSVEAIADQLKITSRVVRAIEDGDAESMPHAVYARGFIRSYAGLLGIEEGLVREVCAALKDLDEEPLVQESLDIASPRSRSSSRIPWFTVLLCLIFILGGIWYFRDRLPLGPLSSVGKVAEQVAPPAEPFVPEEAVVAPFSESSVDVSGTEPVVSGEGETVSDMPTDDAAVSPASVPEAAEEDVRESAVPAGHSVVVSAVAECWMHTTADGKNISQRTMRKGESVTVTFTDRLVLKLGNAGGVRIVYDGRDVAQVGKPGQVRTIVFPQDAQN